jgi:hypothetical protein
MACRRHRLLSMFSLLYFVLKYERVQLEVQQSIVLQQPRQGEARSGGQPLLKLVLKQQSAQDHASRWAHRRAWTATLTVHQDSVEHKRGPLIEHKRKQSLSCRRCFV